MWSGSLANQKGFQIDFPSVGSSARRRRQRRSRAAVAQRDGLLIEDTVTWLKGSHSISLGGVVHAVRRLGEELRRWCPTINFGVVTERSGAGAVHDAANFPGASATQLDRGPEPLRVAHRARHADRRATRGSTRRPASTTTWAPACSARACARTDVFVQDSVARPAEPDHQRRAALRRCSTRSTPMNSSYSTATMTTSAACPASTRRQRVQPVPAGRPARAASRRSSSSARDERAYNIDYDNIAPSVGVAWTPAARRGFLGTLMGPRGGLRRPRRLHARLQPQRAERLHRASQREPGRGHSERRSRLQSGQRWTTGRRSRSSSGRHRRLGAPIRSRGLPVYPLTDVVTEDDQHRSIRTSRCRTPTPGPPASSAGSDGAWRRSALRRHARRATTGRR